MEVILNQKIFHGSQNTPAHYAHIYDDWEKRGSLIPVNDIWIAAMAIEFGLPLLARDAAALERIAAARARAGEWEPEYTKSNE